MFSNNNNNKNNNNNNYNYNNNNLVVCSVICNAVEDDKDNKTIMDDLATASPVSKGQPLRRISRKANPTKVKRFGLFLLKK
jgi:hypothetical protein